MAMTFKAPDGNVDLMCISMPVFPVNNAEDFIALNKAAQASPPDTPKPTPIEQFLAAHPAALKFVTTPKPMPVSYATQQYFAIHAYKFTNAAGEENYVRYHIIPEAGLAFVTAEDAAKRPPNVLLDELTDRLKTGPAKFRLEVQVAEPGDVVNDSTIAWPDSRRVVNLGEIDVTRPGGSSARAMISTALTSALHGTFGVRRGRSGRSVPIQVRCQLTRFVSVRAPNKSPIVPHIAA
jgi:catalase